VSNTSRAALDATRTIPIVGASGDPVHRATIVAAAKVASLLAIYPDQKRR
jgi:hypothetical protein